MAPPARDAYQVGWICALPIEAAAAKQMLDDHFGTLDEQDSTDTNSYTLGRVGKHYVVIACLPLGQYGTTSAAAVATNMTRTFSRSLRIGLMVGIGGGIPSADHDVRLGDIVVSRPDGTCGGVLQYDMGKVVKGGTLQRTGSLNSPPRSLLTAVANMTAAALTDDPSYPESIEKATQRNSRTRQSFGRPDTSTDRLFKIEHEHPTTAATCEGCLSEWEETRHMREEATPQVHYGIIASGNAVIKHGATRERLCRETGALCFEMEAAGLMQDFPCIVIRGICDYADSHKNKQWQGYAALAAASYAKELLGYIPVGRVSEEKLVTEICRVVDGLKEVHESIEKTRLQQKSQHQENMASILSKDEQACHQAFKTSTYEQYKNINPDRAEGTCRWILENPSYVAWHGSGHNDLLWISADPGCGKSVLAKSLVDIDLKTSSTSVSVCYFFFKDNDEQNNLAAALCAVLHQLFGMQPGLLRHALLSWQKNGTKIQGEVNELWRILLTAMSDPASSNTVCILDALDECRPADQAQLIEKLEKFYTQSHSLTFQSWLKFLVTSRPYADIQDGFRPATKSYPYIHIRGEEDNDQIREEISLVVRMRVAELGESLHLPPETQQRLEHQLLQMQHRTYLWLYLVMGDIRTMFQNSLQPEGESLELIPGSVSAAYEKILNRVLPNKVSDVKMILKIIVGARRPLTIEEMAMAIGLAKSPGSRTAAKAGLNLAALDKKIRHLCGLFVFINNSRVYLIHQTAREFLINKNSGYDNREWSFKQGDTEELMSEICINYLLLDDVDGSSRQSNGNAPSLLEYSAEFWPDHVRGMPSLAESKAETRLDQLYDVTSPRFALWYPIFWKAVMEYESRPRMNAIRLAAFNGHENVIRRLVLGNTSTINRSDEHGANALYWASKRGHLGVVRILLGNGAYVNAQGGQYGSALQAASQGEHVDVVQVLLDNGANVHAQGRFGGNALQTATTRGHVGIVQMLLDKGADVHAEGGQFGYALQIASERGHLKIMQMLLDKGAGVQAQNEQYSKALQAASERGHTKIVRMLLDKGADINAQGGLYGNALQVASEQGHVEIVRMLLDKGADANAKGGFYSNALQAASARGHAMVVKMLLDKEADVYAQGGQYGNALQAACQRGHVEIVQMLLDKGTKVYSPEFYGNALQTAAKLGHVQMVRMLIDKRAYVQVQNGHYSNALQVASELGHIEIVQILLDKGADANTQGGEYGNALQIASARGRVEIVRMLLDKGADANTQGGEYGNALQAASQGGYVEIVRMLLDKGADANTRGGEYGNALQIASARGRVEIVRMLLDKGADANAQGGQYSKALQAASQGGYVEIVRMLLDKGANANTQGGEYGNALQIASARGRVEIVRMLLDKGADANTQGGKYGNALYVASERGYNEISRMLLDKGADANAQGGQYGNSLQAASGLGHNEIVRMLLDKGADANAQGGQYGNALQAASGLGHNEIVRMLLEKGADANAQGGQYGNALQAASLYGHAEIVRMLLDKGADANTQGGEYGNALQAASLHGHAEIVQLLLDKGADANTQGGKYGNALYVASERGHNEIVRMLLDKGADANAQCEQYGNALQAASMPLSLSGHIMARMVHILLDKGADVTAQCGQYGNALQAASVRGHIEIVRMLLDKGADANTPGGQYGNALQAASVRGHIEIVQMLADKGAHTHFGGGNAPQAASEGRLAKRVKLNDDKADRD